MTRLVAIANKQAQLQELIACARHFDVDELELFSSAKPGRMGLDGARLLLNELFPGSRLKVSAFDIKDKNAIADILSSNADVLALPLYHASAFYRRVPLLRRRSTIVHVTDGLGDLFTMWELQQAVMGRANIGLVKAALVIPQLYACRADLEFNPFHPERSPYAKRSLQAGSFPMTAGKRRRLGSLMRTYRPEALIIDGFDLTAKRLAAGTGLASYLATRRDGGLIIDGRIHLPDEIICAEEVLEVMRPAVVVGCPSTSLAAARRRHDDLPVFCITTEDATRFRGPRFNSVFEKYGKRFGITFAGGESVRARLDAVGELIAATSRDSAVGRRVTASAS